MDTDDKYTRITLRIPKELHAQLQLSSDQTSKSMNAEIVARLQQSFEENSEIQNYVDALLEMSQTITKQDRILQKLAKVFLTDSDDQPTTKK